MNTDRTSNRFTYIAVGLVAAAVVVLLVAVFSAIGCGSNGSGGAAPSSVSSSSSSGAAVQTTQRQSSSSAQVTSVSSSSTATSSASSSAASSSSSAIEKEESSSAAPQSDGTDEPSNRNAAEIEGFQPLSQYPELPNGCEITSLASVLNFYGFDVSKTTLSDVYLDKKPVGEADFYTDFVGDPRDDDAYGCYSPVLVEAANEYLEKVGSPMRADDLEDGSPDALYSYVDRGVPVIVWATQGMQPSHYSVTWNVNGQSMAWRTPEHCLVLVGYDKENEKVKLADPMTGGIEPYEMDVFEERHSELYDQAIVIQ